MDNDNDDDYRLIRFMRRPWYEWTAWLLWAFLEVLFAQAAIASSQEFEPRAAMLFWLMFGVLLLGGATVYIIRRERLL